MLRRTTIRPFTATVGTTVANFTCVRKEPAVSDLADPTGIPMEGSLWKHKESGTKVIFFNSKEQQQQQQQTQKSAGEKACVIAFCTPAQSDRGETHILEHSVLCGSEKFPTVRDPFFKMLRRSLSTFMNAMTGPSHTVYPFSTVNERDFFNILTVYLDCTLHPLLRPLDFAQEAHRLKATAAQQQQQEQQEQQEQSSPRDSLHRTGVVLNEMKGALSDATTYFHTKLAEHAHSGTPYSLCFGGAPADIPKLTHSELVSYYARHYQQPIVALYDSSVGATSEERRAFLEKSLSMILTEVSTPRKVLLEQQQQQQQDQQTADKITALERLRQLRIAQAESTQQQQKVPFRFFWGPPDPMAQQQQQQQQLEQGDTTTTAKQLTTSRLGLYAPLPNLIQSKEQATRSDHRTVFQLNLLLHIILRPPSGALYRALLHNGANTSAMASTDIAVVKARIEEITNKNSSKPQKQEHNKQHDTPTEEQEQEKAHDNSTSTIDLMPGCGLDHSAQTPALFIGLQNVPTFASGGGESETLCEAKGQLLRVIVNEALRDIANNGLEQGLVESALHEFELSLRTRDREFAVRATMTSVDALIRGMDPFYSHAATELDNEVAAELKQCFVVEQQDRPVITFFSDFIKQQLLFGEGEGNSATTTTTVTAVAGSEDFAALEAKQEQEEIEALRKSITDDALKTVIEQEQQLLEAQKRVDDGGALPSLDIADIAREPVNFTPPGHIVDRDAPQYVAANKAEQQPAIQRVQSFVTNTAGLAYVRILLPLLNRGTDDSMRFTKEWMTSSKEKGDSNVIFDPTAVDYFSFGAGIEGQGQEQQQIRDAERALALPLFSFLMDKLGTQEKTIGEFDVAVRKVCSGFSCGVTITSLPTLVKGKSAPPPKANPDDVRVMEEQQGEDEEEFRSLRALSISFHAMPENVPKALALLKETFEANLQDLWRDLLRNDPERKAMLVQLLTMYASDLESSVLYSGTKFAASEALLAATVNAYAGDAEVARQKSVMYEAGLTGGLAPLRHLNQIKNAIAELQNQSSSSSATAADPLEPIKFLLPSFKIIACDCLYNNIGATGWCVAGPDCHESIAVQIDDFLQDNVRQPAVNKIFLINDTLVMSETPLYQQLQHQWKQQEQQAAKEHQEILRRTLPGSSTSHVGCVLPTQLNSEHELAPAFALAMTIASQEFLHREVREIGGAYGSGARFGVGGFGMSAGIASFASYRDPTPERTISIFRDGALHRWFRESPPDERMLREAKLSVFGGIDAPIPPHEVGDRTAVSRIDREALARQRKRLLETTLDDVLRAADVVLDPEYTRKAMTCCVLGK